LEVVAVDDHRPFAVKLLRALAVELFERERSRPDVLRAPLRVRSDLQRLEDASG
jgi:hypothetical protein